ncbi:MAG: tRNA uridine-5-carboxymethylaminomethyl(34) synthesis GTPase MnmE [Syntrophobacteraceae bacterium]
MMDLRFLQNDTICAIATPPGEGGIGIIKISGSLASKCIESLFVPKNSPPHFKSHRVYYGWIRDPATHEPVDEVLLNYMAAPHTYTCEDVVEINTHSGYTVLSRILELLIALGVRPAEPGEFTRRAFLNGRIDLSQAEAVIDVIRSKSQKSLQLAGRMLQGELRESIRTLRNALLQLESELEAAMDFSEDIEIEDETADSTRICSRIEQDLLFPLKQFVDHYDSGRILREGLTLVLVGKPNVGKSSLLNALLRRDRAIVTALPGTTRDVIEDSFSLSGVQVRILDTAGIRCEPDVIEAMGIERTIQSVKEADVALWLIDKSRPLNEEDRIVYEAVRAGTYIILCNKSDLPAFLSTEDIQEQFGREAPVISISTFDPSDIEALRDFLIKTFLRGPLEECNSMLIPNLRQKECFDRSIESLARAKDLLLSNGYSDLISYELHYARQQIELVLGIGGDDDLLDHIFSQFCIGK